MHVCLLLAVADFLRKPLQKKNFPEGFLSLLQRRCREKMGVLCFVSISHQTLGISLGIPTPKPPWYRLFSLDERRGFPFIPWYHVDISFWSFSPGDTRKAQRIVMYSPGDIIRDWVAYHDESERELPILSRMWNYSCGRALSLLSLTVSFIFSVLAIFSFLRRSVIVSDYSSLN